MSVSVLSAAKTISEHRNWTSTNLELQKLIYLAHMMYLGRTKGEQELISSPFEAWDYGPVNTRLYHRVKAFGSNSIPDVMFSSIPDLPEGPEKDILIEASESLKDVSSGQLVSITHDEDGAWAKYYQPGAKGIIIPTQAIYEEYIRRDQ